MRVNISSESRNRRSLGRSSRRWEDNINMDFKEVGCEDIDCVRVAECRVQRWTRVNKIIYLQVT